VPAASWVLKIILPIYVAINLLILLMNNFSSLALLQIAADFLLIICFTWPLLYFSDKPTRFPQTFYALIGSDSVISFFAIPAVASLNANATNLSVFAMFGLMVWHWLVIGHIFRHALDKPIFFGLGLSLLYILISSQVMAVLFPVISTQAQ
jgi:hypothetical protein